MLAAFLDRAGRDPDRRSSGCSRRPRRVVDVARRLPARDGPRAGTGRTRGPASVRLVAQRPTAGSTRPSERRGCACRRTGGLAAVALAVAACLPAPMTTQGEDIADLYAIFLGRRDRRRRRRLGARDVRDRPRPPAPVDDAAGADARQHPPRGALDGDPAGDGARAVRPDHPDAWNGRTLAGTGGVNLHVTAFRWDWRLEYPDAGVRLVGHRRTSRSRWCCRSASPSTSR